MNAHDGTEDRTEDRQLVDDKVDVGQHVLVGVDKVLEQVLDG